MKKVIVSPDKKASDIASNFEKMLKVKKEAKKESESVKKEVNEKKK